MTITSDSTTKQDSAAPPSYAAAVAGSGPSSQRPVQQPQAVTRTYSLPGDEQSHLRQERLPRPHSAGRGNVEAQWVPPANEREVKSRARKRFFIAFLWAFGIYSLLALLIGGTVEDAREQGRRHRHSGRHNPHQPIDDAPPMDGHPHPTRTWHKITPTLSSVTVSVQPDEVPRFDIAQEQVSERRTAVGELD